MKNFPVIVDGKEYWISRSVAVAVSLFTFIDKKFCILANKRGPGLPNHVGEWNVISGYLDFDESLSDACIREVWEETGVDIKNVSLINLNIEDDPKRENQVILFRYAGFIMQEPRNIIELTNKNSEPNEVDEVKWIPIEEVDNYQWTSENHKNKIKEYAKYIIDFNAEARTLDRYVYQTNYFLKIK